MNRYVVRDEREATIDRGGDRIAYLVLAFGLLATIAYRGFIRGEESWDLLGLLVLSGVVGAAYRVSQHAATPRWLIVGASAAVVALILAAILVLMGR